VSAPFSAGDVAAWTGGALVRGAPEARFAGVSTDTRALGGAGRLFVALRGERHDAHDFLDRAVAAGAAGLLVEHGRAPLDALPPALPVVAAGDTTHALGDLAAGHRSGFAGPLVAVTGSNGKTTTKEMCAAILDGLGPCLKSRGNWNNAVGLPLALLEREAEHRCLVVELGMNHRGEIAALAAIARPTVGVVTNVGTAHIEFLGSREEIAREKGDLVAALGSDAVAVLNADDPLVVAQSPRTRARVLLFGRAPRADVRAERVRATDDGWAFDLAAPQGRASVCVAGLGEPTVSNALAAAAAALAAGADLGHVAAGLARAPRVPGRMAPVRLAGGLVVIDDTYNANPQSVEAALRSLAERKGAGRGVAVLGDMGELGAETAPAHRAAGALAARLGLDHLVAVGAHARETADGALAAGMDPARIHLAESAEEAGPGLRALVGAGDWVLVKGSRAARMERVVEALARGAEAA
jgi:UDP-N-acetylmuramoyl-tripeptide--D-alanyl-D-alanine ligase